MSIGSNLARLLAEIPRECTLVAVTKTQPVENIMAAYESGHRVFGENKVQELMSKFESLPKDISWHLIGHLQTNKVKNVAPVVTLIHSVDSVKLLDEIEKQASKNKRIISCLLQVHIAEEETKFGFSKLEVLDFVASAGAANLDHVRVTGLMGMATFTNNQAQVRKEFRGLKMLFEKLRSGTLPPAIRMEQLSMGMSGDYKIAIEEGSTMVRVGTAIFGERNQR
jgi:pyridoxal phosphate enzyme (YggS family)